VLKCALATLTPSSPSPSVPTQFFTHAGLDFNDLLAGKLAAPMVPAVKTAAEVAGNFDQYAEVVAESAEVLMKDDPFRDW
jgi:NaMN:DMB phosphoribosyltransferase